MNPQAVIFDMDGVVLHNNHWHLEAWLEYARRRSIPLKQEEAYTRVFGRTNREIILEAYPDTSEETIRQWSAEKEELYREMYAPHFRLAEGLEKLLQLLKQQNLKIALASNAPKENVDFALDKGNIRSFFQSILFEGMAPRPKPFPDIYLLAAKMLGLHPQECLVLEDSPTGIRAGMEAGCRVIGITSTFSRQELFRFTPEVVDAMEEITGLLFSSNHSTA
jgi:beta-phosphoglucomutase